MIRIQAGSFAMGVPQGEEAREHLPMKFRDRAEPVHKVVFQRDFLIGRYAVTRGEFKAFVLATGFKPNGGCFTWEKDGKGRFKTDKDGYIAWIEQANYSWRDPGFRQTDRDPVVCVSATDAEAYIVWLNAKTGQTYRLPSEAEWEYAARAGTVTARFWGDERAPACKYANVSDAALAARLRSNASQAENFFQCNDKFAFTAPVGSFKPNPYGLYDMLGNAWQWTNDCWNETYVGAPSYGIAWRQGNCGRRVPRGGSWFDNPRVVRAGMRVEIGAGDRFFVAGFRLSRTL